MEKNISAGFAFDETVTLGIVEPLYLAFFLYKVTPKSWKKQIRVKGSQCYYEPLIFWICSVLIMLTIQPSIYKALFAAGMASGEIQVWQ